MQKICGGGVMVWKRFLIFDKIDIVILRGTENAKFICATLDCYLHSLIHIDVCNIEIFF